MSRAVESPEWQHRVVHVTGGHRVHFVEEGSGPLIVLLHGYPECWTTWRDQIVPLAEAGIASSRRTCAVRALVAARARRRAPDHRARQDVVGLVQALGESTAIVMGHDWGSGVAWSAAWTRPDVFRAVAGLRTCFRTGVAGRLAKIGRVDITRGQEVAGGEGLRGPS